MSTGFRHICALARAAFLLLLAASSIVSHGGEAYLPKVGPVPLRFAEKPVAPASIPQDIASLLSVPPVLLETNAVGSDVASYLATNSPASDLGTNQVAVGSQVVTNEPLVSVDITSQPQEQLLPTFLSPDAQPLTRELIAEIFRPGPGRTNRTGVSVVLPIETGFAPPQPRRTESSSAVYKSE